MSVIQTGAQQTVFVASPAATAYYGSNGGVTKSFCGTLEKQGSLGKIAAALFRAKKTSARAKVYRGGRSVDGRHMSFRDFAYRRKHEALCGLADLLAEDGGGLKWGWGVDETQPFARNVLYVDLPQGQVSFHCLHRYGGPDYGGDWDGQHMSERRILNFCDGIMRQTDTVADTNTAEDR